MYGVPLMAAIMAMAMLMVRLMCAHGRLLETG